MSDQLPTRNERVAALLRHWSETPEEFAQRVAAPKPSIQPRPLNLIDRQVLAAHARDWEEEWS